MSQQLLTVVLFLLLLAGTHGLANIQITRRGSLGAIGASCISLISPTGAQAAENKEFQEPQITSKFKLGLSGGEEGVGGGEIVIGLYGEDQPQAASTLQDLLSTGLKTGCKDREVRNLQREQLEANKVYNACMGGVDDPVTLLESQVWRIVKDERIDFGSVVGKYVARAPPTFAPNPSSDRLRPSSVSGFVSVREGSDGGFTFSITPVASSKPTSLDQTNIVVGRVVSGLDVVANINDSGVVRSSALSYKALTGTKGKAAPSRSCRYGGDMFCSENKPLRKLTLTSIKRQAP
ncbi:hypothetical protein TrCOL_g3949 [Triparma columacea]|uniref:PPIase cyclophilin-type domain-containing protein n=1 Tax=Triparma columacea TaxID=722753 RepID=A0A9W7L2I0_9STRA|nr:hypothetical protein TrCOL_g3949 [Triparma columacea]